MLTISENAATLLTQSRTQQGMPDDAMLRVAPAADGISLGFVDQAEDGDHTGSAHGLPICVASEVADALEEAKIDVETSGDEPQLVLVPAT